MNNQIEESYCSYEISKLLNQKGFNVKSVKRLIDEYGGNGKGAGGAVVSDLVLQPTHNLACEWLRVNFSIYVTALFKHAKNGNIEQVGYVPFIMDIDIRSKREIIMWSTEKDRVMFPDMGKVKNIIFDTPAAAIEDGLKYVLKEVNLI